MIDVDTSILISASEDLPGFDDFEGSRVVNPFAQTPRASVASQWAEDPRE